MLDILRFILGSLSEFINMLFTIDLGFTTLGGLMCIITFIFPIVLFIVNMLKVKMRGD